MATHPVDPDSGAEAGAAFQKVIDNRGVVATSPLYAMALLGRARAEAMAGNAADARKTYDMFFETWKDADADLPLLKRAQTEYRGQTPISR